MFEEQHLDRKTSFKLKKLGFDEPCVAVWEYNSYNKSESFFHPAFDHSIQTLERLIEMVKKVDRPGLFMAKNRNSRLSEWLAAAPSYQQVIDWFLNNHNVFIEILIFDIGFLEKGKFCFQWRIYDNTEEWFTSTTEYKTIKETQTAAIKEALKLFKTNGTKKTIQA